MREEVKCFLPKSAPQLPGLSTTGTSKGGNQRNNETCVIEFLGNQVARFKGLPAMYLSIVAGPTNVLEETRCTSRVPATSVFAPLCGSWGFVRGVPAVPQPHPRPPARSPPPNPKYTSAPPPAVLPPPP